MPDARVGNAFPSNVDRSEKDRSIECADHDQKERVPKRDRVPGSDDELKSSEQPTISRGEGWELRLGDWRTALAGVTCDAIVCDPPYGERTHASAPTRNDDYEPRGGGYAATGLAPSYSHLTPADVDAFVSSWSERCRGWIVALSCSDLAPVWQETFFRHGRYGFAPLPCVMRGMSVRLAGDGPSSWAVYACVGRPRRDPYSKWGTLDGAYSGPPGNESKGGRGKPRWLTDALVRDYTKPGDVVCDPFAGWGTTLASCIGLRRRSIGAEVDAAAFQEATRRIARPQQGDMFA